MPDEYTTLLENNRVVQFVSRKFQVEDSAERLRLSDPYYRFCRIIELLKTAGVAPAESDTWLDLGCHHGQFLAVISRVHDGTWIGMDDWDLKAAMPFTSFRYYQTDLAGDEWPSYLRRESVRFVSALEVIEHMTDTDRFLRAVKCVSMPGAYLVLSTPNINSLRNRVLVPFGVYPASLEYRNVIHHVRLFNLAKLKALLSEHGFVVRSCIGVSFLPERLLRFPVLRHVSEKLADAFPQLCGNIIVIAQRNDGEIPSR
ncbi:MAG TPA: methyltransferase domain-containing protein [Gemmatimonadaceae bacterium]|nr:methyltransferase domain-containing protein [Gemmatimonadaceae bacterium]